MSSRKWLGVLCGFVTVGALYFSGPCADMRINNAQLDHYADVLARVRHPVGTRRLSTERDLGILVGSGNHCDFFVAELREFDTSWADVQAAYADALAESKHLLKIHLVADEQLEGAHVPYRLHTRQAWGVPPTKTNAYLVYIFRSDTANLDLRCH